MPPPRGQLPWSCHPQKLPHRRSATKTVDFVFWGISRNIFYLNVVFTTVPFDMGLQPIIIPDQESEKPGEHESPGEAPAKSFVMEIDFKWDEVFIIDPHDSYTVLFVQLCVCSRYIYIYIMNT